MTYRNPLTGETHSVPIVSPRYTAWLHSTAIEAAAGLYAIGDSAKVLKKKLDAEPRLANFPGLEGLINGCEVVDDLMASSLPDDTKDFTPRKRQIVTQWLVTSSTTTQNLLSRLQDAIGHFHNTPEISDEEARLIRLAQTTLNEMQETLNTALRPFPGLREQPAARSR